VTDEDDAASLIESRMKTDSKQAMTRFLVSSISVVVGARTNQLYMCLEHAKRVINNLLHYRVVRDNCFFFENHHLVF